MIYQNVDMNDYRWSAYPSAPFEMQKASQLTEDEIHNLPADKKKKLNTIKSDYVGTLLSHRVENESNFLMLVMFRRKAEKAGESDVVVHIDELIEGHQRAETRIAYLTKNEVFRSLAYADQYQTKKQGVPA